jgi:hypothetical protein
LGRLTCTGGYTGPANTGLVTIFFGNDCCDCLTFGARYINAIAANTPIPAKVRIFTNNYKIKDLKELDYTR